MRVSLAFLLIALLTTPALAISDSLATKRDSSSIPQVADTLRVVEVPLRPTWQAAWKSTVAPGWGQFQTKHPIRGSVLLFLDAWLYSDAAFRTWSSIPKLRAKAHAEESEVLRAIAMHKDSANAFDLLASTGYYDSARSEYVEDSLKVRSLQNRIKIVKDSASLLRGRAAASADYRNGEIAWAIGLHAFAIVDAAEEAWLASGGKRPVTEMGSAIWRSMLIPGWGQIYNGHYSKAALLYMGIAGSVTSYFSRQQMVEFWQQETELAKSDSLDIASRAAQTDFFRKRRNQYLWGMGLVYIYQILDAAVDARLSRFGKPFPLDIEPQVERPGVTANYRF